MRRGLFVALQLAALIRWPHDKPLPTYNDLVASFQAEVETDDDSPEDGAMTQERIMAAMGKGLGLGA